MKNSRNEMKFLLFSVYYYTLMPIVHLFNKTKRKKYISDYKKYYKLAIKAHKEMLARNIVKSEYDERFGTYYVIKDKIGMLFGGACYLPTFGICICEYLYNSEYKDAILAHEYGHKVRGDKVSINIFQVLNKEIGADRIAKKLGYKETLLKFLKKELKKNDFAPLIKLIVRTRILFI